MVELGGKISARFAAWRLKSRRYGYTQLELNSIPRENIIHLWKWMRGSSPILNLSLGALGGALILSLISSYLKYYQPDISSTPSRIVVEVYIFIFTGLTCAAVVQGMAEYSSRKYDQFYTYGRRCYYLTRVKFLPARTLATRETLAKAVTLWSQEAERIKADVGPLRVELEAIVDAKVVNPGALERVADIGRLAALAPFQGGIDMRALAPGLLPKPRRVTFRRVLAATAALAPLVSALRNFFGK